MVPSAVPVALADERIGRHYHPQPYATLVVEGGYEEAGDQGRLTVAPGDILLHPPFSAHQDVVQRSRTIVLDVPLPLDGRDWPPLASVPDTDLLIAAARRDLNEAVELLVATFEQPARDDGADAADRLAVALSQDPSTRIRDWATMHGFGREWLSRRFKRLYGIDAAVFRLEARARHAWRQVVRTDNSLAAIAVDTGFADQAHMTRSIGALTGRSPRNWRRAQSVTCVQESASPIS